MSKHENPLFYWLGESFGFRNSRNLAAWAVAGGIAYYLWILPSQRDAARRKVGTHASCVMLIYDCTHTSTGYF